METAEIPTEQVKISPAAGLLAAMSYLVDATPIGSNFHSWRVALIAHHLATAVAPEIATNVFFAGLLHDVGTVGSYTHITECPTARHQFKDPQLRTHPTRSSALIGWLPGLVEASKIARSHHEWWDGRGYPDRLQLTTIPIASRILGIVDTADIAGCFQSRAALVCKLRSIFPLTGFAWNSECWAALVRSTEDYAFYDEIMDPEAIPNLMARTLSQISIPTDLNNEDGVERLLHLVATLVDLKDPSTVGHSVRTAKYARCLAREMQLSEDEITKTYQAGLIHDCGRMGIPTIVLGRSRYLSEEEMTLVRMHARLTIKIFDCLPDCGWMSDLGNVAGHDHERWDGGGYPDGLSGDEIPIIARVISAADALDAITSPSSYRQPLSPRSAVSRLRQDSGTQFDPDVISVMLTAAANGSLPSEIDIAA